MEDAAEVAELLSLVLTQAGFAPIVCPDGPGGVEAVRRHDPPIVTVDVGLPGIDGFEVTRRIREFSAAYVVMISAYTGEADVLGGFAAGADDYVGKPFRPRELRSRLLAGVQRRRPEPDRPASPPPPPWASPVPAPAVSAPPAPSTADASSTADTTDDATHDAVVLDGERVRLRGLLLDPVARVVLVDDVPVEMSHLEIDLLELLLHSGSRVRTPSDLALGLRGEAYVAGSPIRDADRELVVAAMTRLLARLVPHGARWIETTREGSYRLRGHR